MSYIPLKLSFFLNQMGIHHTSWYRDNNIPFTTETNWNNTLDKEVTLIHYEKYYAAGRIDVHNHPEHPFNFEFSVGIMEQESWNSFGDWLEQLTLSYLPDSVEDMVELYETQTGLKINWWKGESNNEQTTTD